MPKRSPAPALAPALLVACAALAACADPGPAERPAVEAGATPDTAPAPPPGRLFERTVVFVSTRGDSTLFVPWFVSARTRPGGVDRQAQAMLARSGTWETFLDDRWESPPTRQPWRVVPHDGMRLLVGEGDALERLIFSEGQRQLELLLRNPLVEWSGPRGETFRLVDGSLLLASERVDGLVLDLSRARAPDGTEGDAWALLTSGDSLQALLYVEGEAVRGEARGWGRVDFRELQWPVLTVDWSETRAFERARRDVPVAWRITSPDGELEGTLEVRSAHLEAGEGEGPQLPVDALFEVTGTLTLEGQTYPVRGLFRHLQP